MMKVVSTPEHLIIGLPHNDLIEARITPILSL